VGVLNTGDVQGKTFPNPCVGCVLVKDGKVVGEGFHPKAGLPHAEVMCVHAHFHIHWSIRNTNIDNDVCMHIDNDVCMRRRVSASEGCRENLLACTPAKSVAGANLNHSH
jgi:pyrimidine deaminase RibD-like protein